MNYPIKGFKKQDTCSWQVKGREEKSLISRKRGNEQIHLKDRTLFLGMPKKRLFVEKNVCDRHNSLFIRSMQ